MLIILKKWDKLNKEKISNGVKRIKKQFGLIGTQFLFSIFFLYGMLRYILPNLGYHIKGRFIVYLSIALAVFLSNLTYSQNKSIKGHLKKYIASFIIFNAVTIILLIIPLLAGDLSFSLNPNKNFKEYDWLSFFGTYFGIIASIGGIYWQVTRSEYKKEEETKKQNLSDKKNLIKYLILGFEKNTRKFARVNEELEIKKIHELIFEMKQNELQKGSDIFFIHDRDYVSRNIEKIMDIKNGEVTIHLIHEIISLNMLIKEKLYFFDLDKTIEDLEQYHSIYLKNDEKKIYDKSVVEILLLQLELLRASAFYLDFSNESIKKYFIQIKEKVIIYQNKFPFDIMHEMEHTLTNALSFNAKGNTMNLYIFQLFLLSKTIKYLPNGIKVITYNELKIKELEKKISQESLLFMQFYNEIPKILEITEDLIEKLNDELAN